MILNLSVYPLLLLIILCLSRLALNIEFPFTAVIHSNTIYPKIVASFNTAVIQINAVTIHTFDLFLVLHKISDGKGSKIRIIKTPIIDIPIISGLRKPTIYLPNTDLSDIELYHILLHEWTHYIHKDLWTKLLVRILCVIFWWNPFIYLLKYNIDHTFEIKSDLYLTHTMTDKEKFDYLKTILKIAKNLKKNHDPTSLSSIGFITKKNHHPLKQRFEFVLECSHSKMLKKILQYYP